MGSPVLLSCNCRKTEKGNKVQNLKWYRFCICTLALVTLSCMYEGTTERQAGSTGNRGHTGGSSSGLQGGLGQYLQKQKHCVSHSGLLWWSTHVVLKGLMQRQPLLYWSFDSYDPSIGKERPPETWNDHICSECLPHWDTPLATSEAEGMRNITKAGWHWKSGSFWSRWNFLNNCLQDIPTQLLNSIPFPYQALTIYASLLS